MVTSRLTLVPCSLALVDALADREAAEELLRAAGVEGESLRWVSEP